MALASIVAAYTKPSTCCHKRDLDKLHKACEVLRHGLRLQATRFIQAHRHGCLLLQYGSDCTPLVTKERFQAESMGLEVKRAGNAGHEFLIQRLFLEAGAGNGVVVIEVPIDMKSKSAFAHFGASRELLHTPRELGHQGLVILFHKYDRALKSALSRLHRQMLVILDEDRSATQHPGHCYKLWVSEWYFCEGCFAHDCHGGLRWGLLGFSNDKDTMRSCFLVHESLRHGYNLLVKHCSAWLSSVVGYSDWANPHMRLFYELLDVPTDSTEIVSCGSILSKLMRWTSASALQAVQFGSESNRFDL